MIVRGALIALVASMAVNGWLWLRLDWCKARSATAETCKEVAKIKEELAHETDDDLIDRISDPDGLR